MMKNKNGFTLVELLATLIIIVLLFIIISPKIIDVVSDNRQKSYYEIERRLEDAAAKYVTKEYISSDISSIVIPKEELMSENYIEEIYDIKDNSICDAYVEVSNLKELANFNGVLLCNSYKTKEKSISGYITYLHKKEDAFNNGLVEPLLEDNKSTGIRYRGANPNNYVYYNCKDIDSNENLYGQDNYDYANSCEVWRIIGVFDVENNKGKIEKMTKIIRDLFSEEMSWDSSIEDINSGYGVNEWSQSDLKTMLNSYYLGSQNTCTYCNDMKQGTCSNQCPADVKPLSNIAKSMIEDVLWKTGAIKEKLTMSVTDMYLAERGKLLGNSLCTSSSDYCNDGVLRETKWIGRVGLPYSSDYAYASADLECASDIVESDSKCKNQNWMSQSDKDYWTISPLAVGLNAYHSWNISSINSANGDYVYYPNGVRPTVYLKYGVLNIGNDGTIEKPYILDYKS